MTCFDFRARCDGGSREKDTIPRLIMEPGRSMLGKTVYHDDWSVGDRPREEVLWGGQHQGFDFRAIDLRRASRWRDEDERLRKREKHIYKLLKEEEKRVSYKKRLREIMTSSSRHPYDEDDSVPNQFYMFEKYVSYGFLQKLDALYGDRALNWTDDAWRSNFFQICKAARIAKLKKMKNKKQRDEEEFEAPCCNECQCDEIFIDTRFQCQCHSKHLTANSDIVSDGTKSKQTAREVFRNSRLKSRKPGSEGGRRSNKTSPRGRGGGRQGVCNDGYSFVEGTVQTPYYERAAMFFRDEESLPSGNDPKGNHVRFVTNVAAPRNTVGSVVSRIEHGLKGEEPEPIEGSSKQRGVQWKLFQRTEENNSDEAKSTSHENINNSNDNKEKSETNGRSNDDGNDAPVNEQEEITKRNEDEVEDDTNTDIKNLSYTQHWVETYIVPNDDTNNLLDDGQDVVESINTGNNSLQQRPGEKEKIDLISKDNDGLDLEVNDQDLEVNDFDVDDGNEENNNEENANGDGNDNGDSNGYDDGDDGEDSNSNMLQEIKRNAALNEEDEEDPLDEYMFTTVKVEVENEENSIIQKTQEHKSISGSDGDENNISQCEDSNLTTAAENETNKDQELNESLQIKIVPNSEEKDGELEDFKISKNFEVTIEDEDGSRNDEVEIEMELRINIDVEEHDSNVGIISRDINNEIKDEHQVDKKEEQEENLVQESTTEHGIENDRDIGDIADNESTKKEEEEETGQVEELTMPFEDDRIGEHVELEKNTNCDNPTVFNYDDFDKFQMLSPAEEFFQHNKPPFNEPPILFSPMTRKVKQKEKTHTRNLNFSKMSSQVSRQRPFSVDYLHDNRDPHSRRIDRYTLNALQQIRNGHIYYPEDYGRGEHVLLTKRNNRNVEVEPKFRRTFDYHIGVPRQEGRNGKFLREIVFRNSLPIQDIIPSETYDEVQGEGKTSGIRKIFKKDKKRNCHLDEENKIKMEASSNVSPQPERYHHQFPDVSFPKTMRHVVERLRPDVLPLFAYNISKVWKEEGRKLKMTFLRHMVKINDIVNDILSTIPHHAFPFTLKPVTIEEGFERRGQFAVDLFLVLEDVKASNSRVEFATNETMSASVNVAPSERRFDKFCTQRTSSGERILSPKLLLDVFAETISTYAKPQYDKSCHGVLSLSRSNVHFECRNKDVILHILFPRKQIVFQVRLILVVDVQNVPPGLCQPHQSNLLNAFVSTGMSSGVYLLARPHHFHDRLWELSFIKARRNLLHMFDRDGTLGEVMLALRHINENVVSRDSSEMLLPFHIHVLLTWVQATTPKKERQCMRKYLAFHFLRILNGLKRCLVDGQCTDFFWPDINYFAAISRSNLDRLLFNLDGLLQAFGIDL